MTVPAQVQTTAPARSVQLHPLSRRIMHWINALAMFVMIGSGWRIYNFYPALPIHFGFPDYLTLGGDFTVTEAVSNEDGLANALLWHFAAMWVLVLNFLAYVIVGFVSGHFRRDFLPVSVGAFLRDFLDALRGRLDHRLGEYNAVQRVFYWGVLAAILVTILSGLSIWKPVQLQWLTALFGGYEFARVVHFFGMAAIVGFLVVHLALTALVPKTLVAMVVGRASETPHPRNGGQR
ncbi:MAG: cytochrome b/b6 domain-containing protein [Alphaproteobacteria bacterium]|nr:cytochrome b/b6 domain-containing protein [Alphaproteobacteria bacterium]